MREGMRSRSLFHMRHVDQPYFLGLPLPPDLALALPAAGFLFFGVTRGFLAVGAPRFFLGT